VPYRLREACDTADADGGRQPRPPHLAADRRLLYAQDLRDSCLCLLGLQESRDLVPFCLGKLMEGLVNTPCIGQGLPFAVGVEETMFMGEPL